MTHAEIIEALGDTGELARILNRKDSAVSNWKKRSIPWKVRPQIARLAKERKVLLPADFLVAL